MALGRVQIRYLLKAFERLIEGHPLYNCTNLGAQRLVAGSWILSVVERVALLIFCFNVCQYLSTVDEFILKNVRFFGHGGNSDIDTVYFRTWLHA